MGFRSTRSRSYVAAAAIVAGLVVTSFTPAAAIAKGSHIQLENDPPPLVGVGLPLRASGGGPVRASLRNGSDAHVRLEGISIRLEIAGKAGCIAGNVTATDRDGVATFTDAQIKGACIGFGYELQAIANDRASSNSEHFATSEESSTFAALEVFPCDSVRGCDAPDALGKTAARVKADTGKRVLLEIGGPGLNCSGYAESSETVTFEVVEAAGRVTVRITLDDPDKPSHRYEACFSSDESFTDESGAIVPAGGAGILRDCPDDVGVNADPCVLDKFRTSGDQVVILSVPPSDPRGVI
jgi:hypothetical protein